MQTVAVTGALGNAGRVIARRLEESGLGVIRIDVVPPRNPFFEPSRVVDLVAYGDVVANLHGADSVVHFGSNPWPDGDFFTGADRFRNNTVGTFNVFQAACQLGIKRVVYASSETIEGHPFPDTGPLRIPIRESDMPRPRTAYALSKLTGEMLAAEMERMHGTVFVGLRCSNILHDIAGHYAGYDRLPSYWADPRSRAESLWKYVDGEDVADAVLAALITPLERSAVFNIAAADTVMNTPTRDLFQAYFPQTIIEPGVQGFVSPADITAAAHALGWRPQRSWRNAVTLSAVRPLDA